MTTFEAPCLCHDLVALAFETRQQESIRLHHDRCFDYMRSSSDYVVVPDGTLVGVANSLQQLPKHQVASKKITKTYEAPMAYWVLPASIIVLSLRIYHVK